MKKEQKDVIENPNNYAIVNPHAAVIVWNYNDRLSNATAEGANLTALSGSEKMNITSSIISIQTSKTKSEPIGQFNITLAPTRNWVSSIASGSWCAILMSQGKIDEDEDLKKAKENQVKMIGVIESVRVHTSVDQNGARNTVYTIQGTDWGWIFNSNFYLDPLIGGGDAATTGSAVNISLFNFINSKTKTLISFSTDTLINTILSVAGGDFGKTYIERAKKIGRVAKGQIDIKFPPELIQFMGFKDKDGKQITSNSVLDNLQVLSGKLSNKRDGSYDIVNDAVGFLRSTDLEGSHSLWQILQGYNNGVLNEMFCDLSWREGSPSLNLVTRIRPFVVKNNEFNQKMKSGSIDTINTSDTFKRRTQVEDLLGDLISFYRDIPFIHIPLVNVTEFDGGTNWRDKINFIEIKPDMVGDWQAAWLKQEAQHADQAAFSREGLRSFMVGTRQYPILEGDNKSNIELNVAALAAWKFLLREWYFNTHRLINGSITFTGINDHICVGDNILVSTRCAGPNNNMTSDNSDDDYFLLHVENISNSFTVSYDGARSYTTSIQFVRGVLATKNGEIKSEGLLDQETEKIQSSERDINKRNIINMSNKNG